LLDMAGSFGRTDPAEDSVGKPEWWLQRHGGGSWAGRGPTSTLRARSTAHGA